MKRTKQLNRTQPSDEASVNNNSGNNAKTLEKSVSDIYVPKEKDKEHSPDSPETLTSEVCEKGINKRSSSNIHMEKFEKVSKFMPARKPEEAKTRLNYYYVTSRLG